MDEPLEQQIMGQNPLKDPNEYSQLDINQKLKLFQKKKNAMISGKAKGVNSRNKVSLKLDMSKVERESAFSPNSNFRSTNDVFY